MPSLLDAKHLALHLLVWYSIALSGQQAKRQTVYTKYVCEKSSTKIECFNSQVIHVVSAIYGRYTKTVCEHASISTTMCCSLSSLTEVNKTCEGKPSCTLDANNHIFGDPCPNTYKYLKVVFQCLQAFDSNGMIPSSSSCVYTTTSATTTHSSSTLTTNIIESTIETQNPGTRAVTSIISTQTPAVTRELSTPYTSYEPSYTSGTKALTTTIVSTQTTTVTTLEMSTPYISNEPSAKKGPGLIIGAVSGSLVFMIIVCLLGFIIRSRYIQKTDKEGIGNIYTDLDKGDSVNNRCTKENTEGPGYTQEYTTLNQVQDVPGTRQETAVDFSSSTEYHVLESSNNERSAPRDVCNDNAAFYAVLDPSKTGFDRRTNHINKELPVNSTSLSKNDNDAFYAVIDPLETGFDRRTNQNNKQTPKPHEYLELDPNATGYKGNDKTSLQYSEKDTNFQMSDVYEFAQPTKVPIERENEEEAVYACSNVEVKNKDLRLNTDNIYAHTVDDVYDVSSHVRQASDRDSSYGQFGSK